MDGPPETWKLNTDSLTACHLRVVILSGNNAQREDASHAFLHAATDLTVLELPASAEHERGGHVVVRLDRADVVVVAGFEWDGLGAVGVFELVERQLALDGKVTETLRDTAHLLVVLQDGHDEAGEVLETPQVSLAAWGSGATRRVGGGGGRGRRTLTVVDVLLSRRHLDVVVVWWWCWENVDGRLRIGRRSAENAKAKSGDGVMYLFKAIVK